MRFFFLLFKDPNHERSIANLNYYKRNLKDVLDKLLRDNDSQSQTDKNADLENPFSFKNERPPSVLGLERDSYEALCRGGDENKVLDFFLSDRNTIM